MQISEHFDLREFICPDIFDKFGNNSILFLDERIPPIAEYVRKAYQLPVIINTWHNGGNYKYRGLRPFDSEVGAEFSQHKFGRAFDFHIAGISSEKIQSDIVQKFGSVLFGMGVRAIEWGTDGWTHLDLRNTGLNYIKLIKE